MGKAFEAWAKENGYLYSDGVPRTGVCHAWRAAMEWMKTVVETEGTYPRGTSGCELAKDLKDLKDLIEQELEDTE